MGLFNPKSQAGKEAYKGQGGGRIKPVPAIVDVVNTRLRFVTTKNGARKLEYSALVLAVVEAEDSAGAKAMVNKHLRFDIWWANANKPAPEGYERCNTLVDETGSGLAFCGQRLLALAIACGYDEEFDAREEDKLVDILTGKPYRLKFDVVKKGEYTNLEAEQVTRLKTEQRSRYVDSPDWQKKIGPKDKRMVEPKDFSDGEHSTSSGDDEAGDGFYDDDLPF